MSTWFFHVWDIGVFWASSKKDFLVQNMRHEVCVEVELVSGVHTLIAGFVQVYHRLHVGEEEEKGRKVEQEVERESQVEENAQMTMHMEKG